MSAEKLKKGKCEAPGVPAADPDATRCGDVKNNDTPQLFLDGAHGKGAFFQCSQCAASVLEERWAH